MSTGLLAMACVCFALGQTPAEADYFNQRSLAVPMEIDPALRADIRELLLYASKDQGRSWARFAGPIPPDKGSFAFYAPADGEYWLRAAKITRQGNQEPDDSTIMKGRPDRILIIDTLKPIVRSIQAQRTGDDVFVAWDVDELHPDLTKKGFRVEYQTKGADAWTPIAAPASLKASTQFRPGNNYALTIRLTVCDLAGNASFAIAEVTGTVAAAGFKETPGAIGGNANIAPPPALNDGPTLPGTLTFPSIAPKEPIRPSVTVDVPNKLLPPPPTGIDLGTQKTEFRAPPVPIQITPPPTVVKENPNDLVIADSQTPPKRPVVQAPIGGNPFTGKAPPIESPSRKPLPPLQHLSQHQVTLEYELRRVGPSGVGSIELWLTKDDGANWELFARDEDVRGGAANMRQQRKFEFRTAEGTPFADGIYGLTLVVKNRAGLGKEPRAGDAPEMRIEIDTVAPIAQLYKPIADPQRPDQLLIRWNARDKNLSTTPINLEYSIKPEGPWLPIKVDLENTGKYASERVSGDFSWKVPGDTPTQVYLRLRVRDKAGNDGIAVTSEPQFVDLTEPEGALIGIQTNQKRP